MQAVAQGLGVCGATGLEIHYVRDAQTGKVSCSECGRELGC